MEWQVEANGTGQFTILQQAVDVAASGDTILVGPGLYEDLHLVDHYESPIFVAAYWMDEKSLTFLGPESGVALIGPMSYSPSGDGPQGIFRENLASGNLVVKNLNFQNLYISVNGPITEVENCNFNTGDTGVVGRNGACSVRRSKFENFTNHDCLFYFSDSGVVEDCSLSRGVYFAGVSNGVLRNSTSVGRGLAYFWLSSGVIEDNICELTEYGMGVAIVENGSVVVRRNRIYGGQRHIVVTGPNVLAEVYENYLYDASLCNFQIWDYVSMNVHHNDIIKGYGHLKNLVTCFSTTLPTPVTHIDMENNYWAQVQTGAFEESAIIEPFILDNTDDDTIPYIVDFEPFSTVPVPNKKKSLGSVKAMFR